MRAAHRCCVEPWRAISLASRVTQHPRVERGGDGDGDRPGPVGVRVAPAEPGQDRARQLQHQRRVGRRQRAEGVDAEAGERAVAERGDRGRPRRPLDQPISPTTSPRAISPITRAVPASPPSRPLTTQVAGVRRVALLEQDVAGIAGGRARSTRRPRPRASGRRRAARPRGRSSGGGRCATGRRRPSPPSPARRRPASGGGRCRRAGGRSTARAARTVAVRGQPARAAISPIVAPGPTVSMRTSAGPRRISNDPSTTVNTSSSASPSCTSTSPACDVAQRSRWTTASPAGRPPPRCSSSLWPAVDQPPGPPQPSRVAAAARQPAVGVPAGGRHGVSCGDHRGRRAC